MFPNLDALLASPVGESLRNRASSKGIDLPVLPQSASEVMSMCNSDSCDARELASKIESDQSLAGNVLRISNSAAYAPNEPIVSLAQAVARLGFGTLCEITVAIAVKAKVFNVPGFNSTLSELWTRSTVSAAFAKEIARTLRKNVEGAFLSGLLHDIGKPVALQMLSDSWSEAGQKETIEMDLAEAVMDQFSGGLGGVLLRQWDFAPWMQAAVEFSHCPEDAGEFKGQARVTFLAHRLTEWAMGLTDDTEECMASLQVVADLEIYEDEFQKILARKDAILELAESFS